jgi:hypothetical protein
MWDKVLGTDAKPGQCNNCGSTNVQVQAQNRFLRKAQTYATRQDCGKTTPLSGLLGK